MSKDNPLESATVGELYPLVEVGPTQVEGQPGWMPSPNGTGVILRHFGGEFFFKPWVGDEIPLGTYQVDGWTAVKSGLVLITSAVGATLIKWVAWNGDQKDLRFEPAQGFFVIDEGIFLSIDNRLYFLKL